MQKQTSETRRWDPTSYHIRSARYSGSQNLESRRRAKKDLVLTTELSHGNQRCARNSILLRSSPGVWRSSSWSFWMRGSCCDHLASLHESLLQKVSLLSFSLVVLRGYVSFGPRAISLRGFSWWRGFPCHCSLLISASSVKSHLRCLGHSGLVDGRVVFRPSLISWSHFGGPVLSDVNCAGGRFEF